MSVNALTGRQTGALLVLQATADTIDQTQQRIATGNKVNSALDGPSAYFRAQDYTNRSNDLALKLDDMNEGIQTIKAADTGLTSITKLVEQAKTVATEAKTKAGSDRATLKDQFNTLISQIKDIASDSSYGGQNLLAGDATTIDFNEDESNSLTVTGKDYTTTAAAGLNVLAATTAVGATGASWDNDVDHTTGITAAIDSLSTLLTDLRSTSAKLGRNLAIVEARQTFTKKINSVLQQGASSLVSADVNEEAAKLSSLQTKQQLAATALGIVNQSQQTALQILR